MGLDPGNLSEIKAEQEQGECYQDINFKNTYKQIQFCEKITKNIFDTCIIEQKLSKSICSEYDDHYFIKISLSKKKSIKRFSNKIENQIKLKIAKLAYSTCFDDSNLFDLYWIDIIDLDKEGADEFYGFYDEEEKSKKNFQKFGFRVIKKGKNNYTRVYSDILDFKKSGYFKIKTKLNIKSDLKENLLTELFDQKLNSYQR